MASAISSDVTDAALFRKLQFLAVQNDMLVTRPEVAGLKIVGQESSQLLLQRLFQRAQALPVADLVQSAIEELGLSEFLTTECIHRIRSDLALLLLGRVRSLSLPDVRTEVLESWLEEVGPDSSESSMSCCGDCMVEQDRQSRKSLAVLHWFKASFLQVTARRKSSNDRKDVQNVGYFVQARGYFTQEFGRFVQSCASRCLHVW
ncbi:MAG: hypothetical protein ABF968_08960 [Acetobacter sp.]|uniref:hypothetical protein n=1 Tax=Acetobacter sp. TaxID=440 RepID=UPI0039EAA7AD